MATFAGYLHFMDTVLVNLEDWSDFTKMYFLPQVVSSNSPKTSMETDYNGASTGNSWSFVEVLRNLMKLRGQVVNHRAIS